MKLDELFEAMAIAADVSIDDARREGNNYIIDHVVGDKKYELKFYAADSDAAKFAGAKSNMWAFTFRIAPTEEPKKSSRKGSTEPDAAKDFKMQNFNSGIEFKVIPIMMGYIADFITKIKPEAFMFSADRGEESRGALYRKLIKRYGRKLDQLGYRVMADKDTRMDALKDLQPFIFLRKDLT